MMLHIFMVNSAILVEGQEDGDVLSTWTWLIPIPPAPLAGS